MIDERVPNIGTKIGILHDNILTVSLELFRSSPPAALLAAYCLQRVAVSIFCDAQQFTAAAAEMELHRVGCCCVCVCD